MKRLIIVGSPRTAGRSAHLAEMIFESNIDEHPEDELFLVPVSEVEIGPCIGCNGCRETSGVILKDEDGAEVTVQKHRCVFDDDMQTLYDLLDDADEVTVVSPLYFSGAPAPLKCLLDRLQPYFWANARASEKRPAELHILGEGGDPHGFAPLLTEVKSALAVAGFRLEKAFDWVGKIDEEGEITAEADEVDLLSLHGYAYESIEVGTGGQDAAVEAGTRLGAEEPAAQSSKSSDSQGKTDQAAGESRARQKKRPKLDLGKGGGRSRRGTETGKKASGDSSAKTRRRKGDSSKSNRRNDGKSKGNQRQPSKGPHGKGGHRG